MSRPLALTLAALAACTPTDRDPIDPGRDAGPRLDGGRSDAGALDAGAAPESCPEGHMPLSARFRLGTAQFEVGGCSFMGGGHTMGYEFHRLTIEDTSPALMPADRRKLEFTTKAEVDAVLNYRWNHHNACDSFHLALPHADYAASSAPLAGCGTQVPNAPPRSFDEPFDAPVRYRTRYYGGAWVDADATGCSQYMSCM